jgi:hypothetical protein
MGSKSLFRLWYGYTLSPKDLLESSSSAGTHNVTCTSSVYISPVTSPPSKATDTAVSAEIIMTYCCRRSTASGERGLVQRLLRPPSIALITLVVFLRQQADYPTQRYVPLVYWSGARGTSVRRNGTISGLAFNVSPAKAEQLSSPLSHQFPP